MDLYQIATAYWDQFHEEMEAKHVQSNKTGSLKVPRPQNNRSLKSTNLHNLKPAL